MEHQVSHPARTTVVCQFMAGHYGSDVLGSTIIQAAVTQQKNLEMDSFQSMQFFPNWKSVPVPPPPKKKKTLRCPVVHPLQIILGMLYKSTLLESNLLITNEWTMHLNAVVDRYRP